MTTVNLNVYITELGEPCTITNRTWVVAVSHCDGSVLNWSEGRFRKREGEPWVPIPLHIPPSTPPLPQGWYYDSIPAENGHVEIEAPPGCYVLRATMHSWFINGLIYGNWATDHAVVQACCGQDVCTTLYAPTGPQCAVPLFDFVIPLLLQQKIIKREEAQKAIEAMRAIFEYAPKSAFEQEQDKWLNVAFQQMTKQTGQKEQK
jgi:hypothetical protein